MNAWPRRISLGILVLALIASVLNGLMEGVDSLKSAAGAAERVTGITQLLYAALASASLFALAGRHEALWPVLGWAAAASLTGGLAPVVYGGAPLLTGVLSGLAAALLLGLVVGAWWRWAGRKP